MKEHWQHRRKTALKNSCEAVTEDARETYLRLAEHYRSLEEWCSATPICSLELDKIADQLRAAPNRAASGQAS